MLPLDLIAVLWADLNRPTTQAEWEDWGREFDRGLAQLRGQPPVDRWLDRAAEAYQLTRGHFLAARVKEGMTQEEVETIFGAANGQNGVLDPLRQDYWPIGVTVHYRSVMGRINGQETPQHVAEAVEATPWPEIATLLLPDRPWPR
jgi:hypothetical protein